MRFYGRRDLPQIKPPAQARSVVFYFVQLFLAGALLAGVPARAAAEQTVYEHYFYSFGTNRVSGAVLKAQTFTPAVSHTARIVRLRLMKTGDPAGDLTVSLRAADAAGAPAGSVLASAGIACSSVTTRNLWYDFDLGADIALSAGTTYAFVMSAPSGDESNYISNNLVNAAGHDFAGGRAWASYDGGSHWTAGSGDTVFKIIGPGPSAAPPSAEPKITCYLNEVSIRHDPAVIANIDYAKIDHLIWAGIDLKSGTDPAFRTGYDWTGCMNHLDELVARGHAAGIKVMVTLRGMDDSLGLVVASDTLRTQLVANLVDFVNEHHLDGVDIDWEMDQSQVEMDTLLNDAAPALHAIGKLISFAGGTRTEACTLSAFSRVDFVNIMNYDMAHGDYRPLHAVFDDATASVTMWADDGYDRSKLYMGIPFYGKDLSTAYDYKTIASELNPSPGQNYAEVAVLNGTAVAGGLVWWNGIDLAKQKTAWAAANGIAGVMVYEVGEDQLQDSHSLLQAIYSEKTSHRGSAAGTFTISGSIRDGGGAPVGAVTVTLTGSRSLSIATGSDGSYRFNGLPADGNYTVTPAKISWSFTPVSISTNGLNGDLVGRDFTGSRDAAGDPVLTESGIKVIGSAEGRGTVNPDRGETAKIYFSGSGAGRFELRIFMLTGELVHEDVQENVSGGMFEWRPENIASGIYIAHVKGPGIAARKKIAIVK